MSLAMDDFCVRWHPDAEVFLERAQGFLARVEAENVLMLGLASSSPRDALLLTVEHGREIVMAALHSGANLILSRGPANAVEALVDRLIADGFSPPGVTGPVKVAGRFADLWRARTGQGTRLHMRMRVHQLTEVVPPDPPSGAFRQAVAADVSLLATWVEAFKVDLRLDDPQPGEEIVRDRIDEGRLRDRIGEGRMYVWDDQGPVSMAACSGPTPEGMRINFVYTPPEYRGRGYASACVADLSQLLLDDGRRFCALFTDLANPVSNRLYARLGYRPVCDFDQYTFVA